MSADSGHEVSEWKSIVCSFMSWLSVFSSLPYQRLFGGAGSFTREHFELINGFSNEFWGWGGEDDDLYKRYNQCILINKSVRSLAVLHMRGGYKVPSTLRRRNSKTAFSQSENGVISHPNTTRNDQRRQNRLSAPWRIRVLKSHDNQDVIVFEKLRFRNVFPPH